jgi:hypothetical protein
VTASVWHTLLPEMGWLAEKRHTVIDPDLWLRMALRRGSCLVYVPRLTLAAF